MTDIEKAIDELREKTDHLDANLSLDTVITAIRSLEAWEIVLKDLQYCHDNLQDMIMDQFYFGESHGFNRAIEIVKHALGEVGET